jgi:FtsP/CotA-like multicopper oxidase with cupredoxin domain
VVLALLAACSAAAPDPASAPTAKHQAGLTLAELSPPDAPDLAPATGVVRYELEAAPIDAPGDYRYAYNGVVPGPTLRAQVGDTVEVLLRNRLAGDTSIHWHGVDVPFEMDGAPNSGPAVQPGQDRLYRFVVQQAGTFWYHPHFDTQRQVDLGLFGAFVVTPKGDPTVGHDAVLVFDAPLEHFEAAAGTAAGAHGGDGVLHDCHSALRPITEWWVNGRAQPTIQHPAGTRLRARLINASNCGYLALSGPDLRHIASDQGLLSAPTQGVDPAFPLVLGPGDRADIEWRVGPAPIALDTALHTPAGHVPNAPRIPLLRIEAQGAAAAPPPWELPYTRALPTPDSGRTDVVYALSGSGQHWFINAQKWPDVPTETLVRGAPAIIEVRNVSPAHHPFHTHGMPFEVLSVDGVVPQWRRIEDTLDLGVHSVARLRVVPPNAGEWMVHCHILPHADQGMMAILSVVE